MMKKLQFMICLLGLLGLGACSDYLEKESSDEVIVKTVSDYSELLLGAGYPSPTKAIYNTLYLLDDDFMLNDNNFNDETDNAGAVGVLHGNRICGNDRRWINLRMMRLIPRHTSGLWE